MGRLRAHLSLEPRGELRRGVDIGRGLGQGWWLTDRKQTPASSVLVRTLHITPVGYARWSSLECALEALRWLGRGASTHYRMRDLRRVSRKPSATCQGVADAPLRRWLDAIAKRRSQLERTVGFPKNPIALCAREPRRGGNRRVAPEVGVSRSPASPQFAATVITPKLRLKMSLVVTTGCLWCERATRNFVTIVAMEEGSESGTTAASVPASVVVESLFSIRSSWAAKIAGAADGTSIVTTCARS